MRSFLKIKSSRIGALTLLFTNKGKSCPVRNFFTYQMCLLTLFAKIKYREKISEFTVFVIPISDIDVSARDSVHI